MKVPRLYLGTMTFGWTGQTSSIVDETVAEEMIRMFCDKTASPHHIDTARIYASGNTEGIVGSALSRIMMSTSDNAKTKPDFILGTKAHPSQNGLSEKGIRAQIETSLHETRVNTFGEYYLHQPDTKTSLLESLKCIHSLISDGTIQTFGMSNYHVDEMKRTFELVEEHNLTKPSVYQGLYNPLNRRVEKELLPLLRKYECSFVAYNPLAGGLLTGKHSMNKKTITTPTRGRFHENDNYLPRFWTDVNFAAVEMIREACAKDGMTLVEGTFHWLMRHSALKDCDGVLLGASSIGQLEENLNACLGVSGGEDSNAVLSKKTVNTFDLAWEKIMLEEKDTIFPYWRSYSFDMPGRETLDQGASYSAKK